MASLDLAVPTDWFESSERRSIADLFVDWRSLKILGHVPEAPGGTYSAGHIPLQGGQVNGFDTLNDRSSASTLQVFLRETTATLHIPARQTRESEFIITAAILDTGIQQQVKQNSQYVHVSVSQCISVMRKTGSCRSERRRYGYGYTRCR